MQYGSHGLNFIFTQDSFYTDRTMDVMSEKEERLKKEFDTDKYRALYRLGMRKKMEVYSPTAAFLFLLSTTFFQTVIKFQGSEKQDGFDIELEQSAYERLQRAVPYAIGVANVNKNWMKVQFLKLSQILDDELSASKIGLDIYFERCGVLESAKKDIFIHIVDSRDEKYPFSLMVTYTSKDKNGKVHQMPLQYALIEYKKDRKKLGRIISVLKQASRISPEIMKLEQSGKLFHPLRITADEAFQILQKYPEFKSRGIQLKVPDWWKSKNRSMSLKMDLAGTTDSYIGLDTLIKVRPSIMINGTEITEEEAGDILNNSDGLRIIKGKWVEVDKEKLESILDAYKKLSRKISLRDALKLDVKLRQIGAEEENNDKSEQRDWIRQFLSKVRRDSGKSNYEVPETVSARLRPYQEKGYSWLRYMCSAGFGVCLADDMGLGKTIQVLAYLEYLRAAYSDAKVILIVPASVIGNWKSEIRRFTHDLEEHVTELRPLKKDEAYNPEAFLTLTTYGMVRNSPYLQNIYWTGVILDEAQAIKNKNSEQTVSVKKLKAASKIAMTGTPIENNLMNLWSVFDFLDKGLLGSSTQFGEYIRKAEYSPEGYTKLKAAVSPFILRRLKTDRSVISELPEKHEISDYVELTKKQTVLYINETEKLAQTIKNKSEIERKGIILSTITKLKEICNHPDQFLGQSIYDPEESGKFGMLEQICDTIYEKREKVIVFTQYSEMTEVLSEFLSDIFHDRGLVMNGKTPVRLRQDIIKEFNSDRYVPYIVLSVKTGGVGINLTAANHVIHFDRWWNPAVENQATDRAFRIGQRKDVMVHKLICTGTIEEKIDDLIESKKRLADDIIESTGGERLLMQMNENELINILRFDQYKVGRKTDA
jgi:SNF2 family DNA or RNA helicase